MLQYRGNNAASERKGDSLCGLRPSGCCQGVDLTCFGCHPELLDMGIPCEQQSVHEKYQSQHSQLINLQQSQRRESTRDCFCDTSCIVFEDCCDDHYECGFGGGYDGTDTTYTTTSTVPYVSMFNQGSDC